MKIINESDMDNLSAILDYCDRIISIVERFGKSFDHFDQDEDYRDAVLMNVFQIGEATNRLSDIKTGNRYKDWVIVADSWEYIIKQISKPNGNNSCRWLNMIQPMKGDRSANAEACMIAVFVF